MEDLRMLNRAFECYRLLTHCLLVARATSATRQYIEDTLMLPWAELRERGE